MTLKSNKTPGIDGLTIEFYRTFWRDIVEPLYNMYLDSFEKNVLPLSTRRGLISLLPKKDKDTRMIKNLRPLTLLNNDYKILAKAIDNRLSPVLPSIISTDQTGFVKGRNIAYNVRKTLDVIDYCKINKLPGVVMSCDMNKCFDRIEHSSIYAVLQRFGFGPNFIKWTSLFYTNFEICTQNYGILSDWFDKSRGVNQGCPASPSIYICIGEAMANCLRNNNNIHGIKINEIEYLLSQFADDTDIYLPFDEKIINEVLKVLSDIEKSTGLLISYEKTTLYRIGSISGSSAQCYTIRPVRWTNDTVNILGIDLHQYESLSDNLSKAMNKLLVVSQMWYYRSLSLIGKVVIVNTLMSSLFIYKFQVISTVPNGFYEQYEQIVKDFLWKGTKAKIALTNLYCNYENGGLRLTNIKRRHSAMLCKWVYECFKSPQISNLANTYICTMNNDLWLYNLNYQDFRKYCLKRQRGFWCDVAEQWIATHYHTPCTKEDVLRQRIQMNSHIRVGNKPITVRNGWPVLIKDIVLPDGTFASHEHLRTEFPNLTWLDYLTIIAAIPAKWKEIVKYGPIEPEEFDFESAFNKKNFKMGKACYNLVNSKISVIEKSFSLLGGNTGSEQFQRTK